MTRVEYSRLLKEEERAAQAQKERDEKAARKRLLQEQREQRRSRGQSFRDKERQRIRERLAFLEYADIDGVRLPYAVSTLGDVPTQRWTTSINDELPAAFFA